MNPFWFLRYVSLNRFKTLYYLYVFISLKWLLSKRKSIVNAFFHLCYITIHHINLSHNSIHRLFVFSHFSSFISSLFFAHTFVTVVDIFFCLLLNGNLFNIIFFHHWLLWLHPSIHSILFFLFWNIIIFGK